MRRAILRLTVVIPVLLLVGTFHVQGRLVSYYSLERIADEAEVIAVGKVVEVARLGEVRAEQTEWHADLLQMRATVTVLRSHSAPNGAELAAGSIVRLPYLAVDWAHSRALVNGPCLPAIATDDVYAFPLRRAAGGGCSGGHWELIAEEDFGLLVPCVEEAIDAPRNTGAEFLLAELAGTFARGEYPDLFKAGKYLGDLGIVETELAQALSDLIVDRVGDDPARWLDICAATYCASPLQRPTLRQLLERTYEPRLQAILAGMALAHIPAEGLDDRLIQTAIKHADIHASGTALTLSKNYPRHPTAVRLMKEALEHGNRDAVRVAYYVVRDAGHPLVPPAVEASVRLLREGGLTEWGYLRAACGLIRDYGDDADFDVLLEEIRTAQREDRERYMRLWQSCAYAKNARLMPIIRIVIEDHHAFSENCRFCDVAGFELQRVTGVDFGLSSDNTTPEREQALERARAWLAENPE